MLDYSVAPSGWPVAIVELSKAIMYVKSIADENNIDKDRIFVCGFSAGGHLAASIGVHWNHPAVVKFSGAENEENKPTGIILGYPVITAEKGKTHQESIDNLVAGREELKYLTSLEKFVSKETPQMFIWHTFSDKAVPVSNSLIFANALEQHKVKFELHIYPDGNHGLALGNEVTAVESLPSLPAVQNWLKMSVRWIRDMK